MIRKKQFVCSILAASIALLPQAALAAASAEEAKQLGNALTEFGAEKAGNADGSIPPYTGGLTKAPAGWTPESGRYADPCKDDKILYKVDAKNAAQYSALLYRGHEGHDRLLP